MKEDLKDPDPAEPRPSGIDVARFLAAFNQKRWGPPFELGEKRSYNILSEPFTPRTNRTSRTINKGPQKFL
jgi:hypothetical protein